MASDFQQAQHRTALAGGQTGWDFKPRLRSLLESLGLDVAYERAAGNTLIYRNQQGELVEVLDFVGGYGSLFFGHSHPTLVSEAVRLLSTGCPIHAQGSVRPYAEELARVLAQRAGGGYCAIFANSGAEAVEGAIKHALLETGGRTFVALERAFHGKTLGALQLTANPQYRDGFDVPGLHVVHVPANDIAALESALARTSQVAGFIFEPIQGEGGVRPLNRAYLQRAAQLCAVQRIPFIADECQTGMGRTGTFLACEQLGVRPDYLILSKALGGGLAKIAALLIDRKRYRDEFDLKHTSTFADDDFSCAIALKAMELLDDPLLGRCRTLAEQLLSRLTALAGRFPGVIADVRGRGLMLGIEFKPLPKSPSLVLRFLSSQEDLGYLLSAYLFHAHRLRVAPTLSDRFTLRLEPSVLIDPTEIDRLLHALADVCDRLHRHDSLGLTSFLAAARPVSAPAKIRTDGKFIAYEASGFKTPEPSRSGPRVAWLCHLADADDLVSLEPSLGPLSRLERERYLERLVTRAWPIAMNGVEIRSGTGHIAWLCPILLPFTSRWVKQQMDARSLAAPRALVQEGVDLAAALGCQMVALGQYTSIVTANGTRLAARGLGLTTGNSYALLLAVQALARAQREAGRRPQDSTLAVIGAVGNIGQAAAEMLAPTFRETLLVGRNRAGSLRRLGELARRIPRAGVTADLRKVHTADVVLVATNAVDAPLDPNQFKCRAIVCDVSVPAAISRAGAGRRKDLLVIKGGVVSLPHHEDLGIVGFPLPAGQTYGCMAEGILLAWEGILDARFTGPITADKTRFLATAAEKHGFGLADFNSPEASRSELNEEKYVCA